MLIRTLLIILLGLLGIIAVFSLGDENYLTPKVLSSSIIILSLALLLDLWKTKWQESKFQKIDAHTESLSFTAHQLRSPLTVIKGYAELISDGTYGDVSSEVKDVGLKIKASADRAFQTIDKILDFNSLIAGRTINKSETVLLNHLIDERIKTFELLAKEKKLDLIFVPNPAEINVVADSSQLEHIISNIIDNALKYTAKGKIEIHTTLEQSGKSALVEVSDSGNGIPPEIIETIFMPFERDPRYAHDMKGMGLGLSIARKLCELNKCEVWAKSDGIGKGATFYLRIPIASK
mgnify:CR=1 FL=1